QFPSLLGKLIGDPAPVRGIRLAPKNVMLHQPRKPIGEDVARDTEGRLELLEMAETVEGAAQNQERPAFANSLQRPRERAIGEDRFVISRLHRASLRLFSALSPGRFIGCIMKCKTVLS